MSQSKKEEWIKLIKEAKKIGLTQKDIQNFLEKIKTQKPKQK